MRFLIELLGLLECIISLCTIIIYMFLFYLLTRTRLLHTAFRTTARIYSVAVTIYLLFRILEIIEAQTHVFSQIDPSMALWFYRATMFFSFSFWLSLSFITLERAIASYFVHSYERKFNSLQAQLLLTILFISIDIAQNICRVVFPTPTLLIVCFCNTFVNLGVMFFIKRVNKGRNSLEKHLSYRYQVKENVLISSAILPLTYISFIFTFSIFPFLYLMKKESDPESRQLYTALFFLVTAFYPPTYAIGLLRSAAFRRVIISLGLMKEKREMIAEHEQYEQTRSKQDEEWQVSK